MEGGRGVEGGGGGWRGVEGGGGGWRGVEGGGGVGGPPMPWTLNVYSARALCFLGFLPKTFLELGSRLRKAFYRIAF